MLNKIYALPLALPIGVTKKEISKVPILKELVFLINIKLSVCKINQVMMQAEEKNKPDKDRDNECYFRCL